MRSFNFYSSRAEAMKQPDQQMVLFVMYFDRIHCAGCRWGLQLSLTGCRSVKSNLSGLNTSKKPEPDSAKFPVTAAVYPGRLRALVLEGMTAPNAAEQKRQI